MKVMVFGCEHRCIEKEIEAENEKEAALKFFRTLKIVPESVNDKTVEGLCECCLDVILEGEDYILDEEGIYLCKPCADECAADFAREQSLEMDR